MKKNMLRTMDRLDIDLDIRDLLRQLWKHGYKTEYSCDGHGSEGYVMFREESGDGWFEENSFRYGLSKRSHDLDCYNEFREEMIKHGLTEEFEKSNVCSLCGTGLNGYSIYRGKLIQNPFKPNLS